MIYLQKEVTVVGAINEILLDQESKREKFTELELRPRMILSYACLIRAHNGFAVSWGFDEDALERFFLARKDVFEQMWNIDNSFSFRLRIEKFLCAEELEEARTVYLRHSSAVSVAAQLLMTLDAIHDNYYPSGFLDNMKLYEARHCRT